MKMEKKEKLAVLLKRIMSMAPMIQLYHWQTRSHARHVAAGQLYEKLIGLTDEFMEVFMGRHNRIRLSGKTGIPIVSLDSRTAENYLKDNIAFFSNLENFLPELKRDTDLLNIRDAIVGELNRTLYLFTLR